MSGNVGSDDVPNPEEVRQSVPLMLLLIAFLIMMAGLAMFSKSQKAPSPLVPHENSAKRETRVEYDFPEGRSKVGTLCEPGSYEFADDGLRACVLSGSGGNSRSMVLFTETGKLKRGSVAPTETLSGAVIFEKTGSGSRNVFGTGSSVSGTGSSGKYGRKTFEIEKTSSGSVIFAKWE